MWFLETILQTILQTIICKPPLHRKVTPLHRKDKKQLKWHAQTDIDEFQPPPTRLEVPISSLNLKMLQQLY
jgi:hypothetical protein